MTGPIDKAAVDRPVTNWIEHVHPELSIRWVETYMIQWDACVAIPVLSASQPANDALKRGIIREVSAEKAQQLNTRFASESVFQFDYLLDLIAVRWREMLRQNADMKAASPD